jgi:hypothetical protein
MAAEVTAEALMPIILVKLEFDSGDFNLWNGIGEIVYESETYNGAGNLIAISDIAETQVLEAAGLTISLSGVPSAILSYALSEDYQGRPANVWFAALNTSFNLITDPYQHFKGAIDTMSIDEGADNANISLSIENDLIDFRRPIIRNWTPEDQAITYPGDTAFDFAASLQNKEIVWGQT